MAITLAPPSSPFLFHRRHHPSCAVSAFRPRPSLGLVDPCLFLLSTKMMCWDSLPAKKAGPRASTKCGEAIHLTNVVYVFLTVCHFYPLQDVHANECAYFCFGGGMCSVGCWLLLMTGYCRGGYDIVRQKSAEEMRRRVKIVKKADRARCCPIGVWWVLLLAVVTCTREGGGRDDSGGGARWGKMTSRLKKSAH